MKYARDESWYTWEDGEKLHSELMNTGRVLSIGGGGGGEGRGEASPPNSQASPPKLGH